MTSLVPGRFCECWRKLDTTQWAKQGEKKGCGHPSARHAGVLLVWVFNCIPLLLRTCWGAGHYNEAFFVSMTLNTWKSYSTCLIMQQVLICWLAFLRNHTDLQLCFCRPTITGSNSFTKSSLLFILTWVNALIPWPLTMFHTTFKKWIKTEPQHIGFTKDVFFPQRQLHPTNATLKEGIHTHKASLFSCSPWEKDKK